jgi:hypothetical protein
MPVFAKKELLREWLGRQSVDITGSRGEVQAQGGEA